MDNGEARLEFESTSVAAYIIHHADNIGVTLNVTQVHKIQKGWTFSTENGTKSCFLVDF